MDHHDDVLIVRDGANLTGYWQALEAQPGAAVDPAVYGLEVRSAAVRFHRQDWPHAASARLSIDGKRRTYPVRHGVHGLVVRPDR